MTASPSSPTSASKTPNERATTPTLESVLLNAAGHRRSPATLPGYHQGRPPRNKGLQYPPDPATVEEIVAVMRAAGEDREGVRLRGVIVVLWRAGLRISEALGLAETDLDQ
jgi:integrase